MCHCRTIIGIISQLGLLGTSAEFGGQIQRLNVRIADEMRRLTRDPDFANFSTQCQRVHDGDYMRHRMLEELAKEKTKGE